MGDAHGDAVRPLAAREPECAAVTLMRNAFKFLDNQLIWRKWLIGPASAVRRAGSGNDT